MFPPNHTYGITTKLPLKHNWKCSKCISIQVREILATWRRRFLLFFLLSNFRQSYFWFLLLLGAEFPPKLTIYFIWAVLFKSRKQRLYFRPQFKQKKKRSKGFCTSDSRLIILPLFSYQYHEIRHETQKCENKKSRCEHSPVLNERDFSSWIWTRLFATKRMFEAVWEPNELYTDRGLSKATSI